jgi:hypothetical protein
MKPTIAFRVDEKTKFKLEELSKMRNESQGKIIEWVIDIAFGIEEECKRIKERRLQEQDTNKVRDL